MTFFGDIGKGVGKFAKNLTGGGMPGRQYAEEVDPETQKIIADTEAQAKRSHEDLASERLAGARELGQSAVGDVGSKQLSASRSLGMNDEQGGALAEALQRRANTRYETDFSKLNTQAQLRGEMEKSQRLQDLANIRLNQAKIKSHIDMMKQQHGNEQAAARNAVIKLVGLAAGTGAGAAAAGQKKDPNSLKIDQSQQQQMSASQGWYEPMSASGKGTVVS